MVRNDLGLSDCIAADLNITILPPTVRDDQLIIRINREEFSKKNKSELISVFFLTCQAVLDDPFLASPLLVEQEGDEHLGHDEQDRADCNVECNHGNMHLAILKNQAAAATLSP